MVLCWCVCVKSQSVTVQLFIWERFTCYSLYLPGSMWVSVCVWYNNSLQQRCDSESSRWISLTLFFLIRAKSRSSHIEDCVCLYSDCFKLWTHMWGFIVVSSIFFIVQALSRHFPHQKTSPELLRRANDVLWRQWKHWPHCCITAVHVQRHTHMLMHISGARQLLHISENQSSSKHTVLLKEY